MHTNLRHIATACTLGLTVALAAFPAQAQIRALGKYQALGDQFYNDPQEAPHGLRFADLEAATGTDPLTWSSDPGWKLHRTPENQLTEATDIIRAAIPAGTSAAEAAALLGKAGARCANDRDAQIVCHYRDAETPDSDAYFDNVLWRVWLDTAGGRVTHVAVTRDWMRH
jgi:hypothetical protein